MKRLACGVSGAIMAAAGSLYPLYALYVDPVSAFSLTIALNALAMPLIGGTSTWLGPVIGAVLLASVQQITTVTIESKYNVLVVGLVLIAKDICDFRHGVLPVVGTETPVYPVNRCGVYLRESKTNRALRDNPAFSAQASRSG